MAKSLLNKEGEEIRLNLTPMIDAVFLLLIFFMVTTVFTHAQQLAIELPKAENYDRLKERKLKVAISAAGELEIGGRLVAMAELAPLLESEKRQLGATSLIIKADAKTQHGFVLDVMEIANAVGVERVSVETDEPKPTRRN